MAGEGRVHLTTFIEGLLVHGKENPFVLVVPCIHSPHRGLLMPVQVPWSPGFLPTALLNAQIDAGWRIPFRFVDPSTQPVVFDERTSRLPTPWLLRLESLEGQQRLYLTHLLATKSTSEELPSPPPGGVWLNEKTLQSTDLLPGVRRLCLSALQTVRES